MEEKSKSLPTSAIVAIAIAVVAVPCCAALTVFGAILIFSSSSGVGPFIYNLF